jgi:hypothetical protein
VAVLLRTTKQLLRKQVLQASEAAHLRAAGVLSQRVIPKKMSNQEKIRHSVMMVGVMMTMRVVPQRRAKRSRSQLPSRGGLEGGLRGGLLLWLLNRWEMKSRRSLKESWRARKDRPILSWKKKRKRSRLRRKNRMERA